MLALAFGVGGTEMLSGVAGCCGPDAFCPLLDVWWGCSVSSDAEVITEPASDALDPRRPKDGRGSEGNEGVRE